MEKFTVLRALAAALPEANVDTDIIFPARFLLLTEKKGLGQYAFYERRFDADGHERPGFVLNREPFRRAEILVAGDNFGSGSSREQAPWALRDFGIRCVISTSFGEIFHANCYRNSMLPVTVAPAVLAALQGDAAAGLTLTVDLEQRCVVRPSGERIAFEIPEWRRNALLHGWDEIAMILNEEGERIAAFEAQQRRRMPWLYLETANPTLTTLSLNGN